MNYYNEHDPNAAAWLAELVERGLIPHGLIDTRSIVDVRGSDLAGYVQCHFFAGIGGWPFALQLAGWPATRPVWTGSCPCQPFSCAGKGKGTADERHLWPEFARLIGECAPSVVFGEQVASRAGREWLSGVFADLEGMGYAAAGADLCAASVGAPHIRQRLFWVAYGDGSHAGKPGDARGEGVSIEKPGHDIDGRSVHGPHGLPHAGRERLRVQGHGSASGAARGMQDADGQRERVWADARADGSAPRPRHTEGLGRAGRADSGDAGRRECAPGRAGAGSAGRLPHAGSAGSAEFGRGRDEPAGLAAPGIAGAGFWDSWEPLHFRDGKTRRTKPGLFCLAHGVSARVVRLRGYGNAIVPQAAAQFVRAADATRLMTEAELEAFTWNFPADWPEYERIEKAHNALCDAGRLVNKPLD